eukprot:scaffold360_cov374-Pavlova_lutheri.AAC.68
MDRSTSYPRTGVGSDPSMSWSFRNTSPPKLGLSCFSWGQPLGPRPWGLLPWIFGCDWVRHHVIDHKNTTTQCMGARRNHPRRSRRGEGRSGRGRR